MRNRVFLSSTVVTSNRKKKNIKFDVKKLRKHIQKPRGVRNISVFLRGAAFKRVRNSEVSATKMRVSRERFEARPQSMIVRSVEASLEEHPRRQELQGITMD